MLKENLAKIKQQLAPAKGGKKKGGKKGGAWPSAQHMPSIVKF